MRPDLPGSSGNTPRSLGIVGSIKGLGVLVSKYMGRLIATLDPLRFRIFAVRVLSVVFAIISKINYKVALNET